VVRRWYPEPMDSPDLRAPQHYINRELSFLEFNQRVLDQAFDESVPLLERLKFLCISCSNLDEFFEIRVAGLKQLQELGGAQLAADGMSIPEQLAAIHDRATRLVADQYRCLNSLLLPALAAEGVPLLGPAEWTAQQGAWLEQYFEREVEPVLSPLGLDPARPFPRIQNKSLNFIVRLEGKDAFDRDSELAIVQAPRSLPRVVPLPGEGAHRACVLLSSIVQAFVHKLFTGIKVIGCYQFRVTRNTDLFACIRHEDVLLHHPYQSFAPVMDLLRQAAADSQVLAIKQTLYRAGHDSPLVDALVAAAHAGKDVTVIVELRARFDEEANIELSNRLQEAGAHVMYGVVGYKTHAKLTLIVRREAGGIRRYCHLGTGNYHPRTARHYTDYGLFTCDDEIGQDVHELFLQL